MCEQQQMLRSKNHSNGREKKYISLPQIDVFGLLVEEGEAGLSSDNTEIRDQLILEIKPRLKNKTFSKAVGVLFLTMLASYAFPLISILFPRGGYKVFDGYSSNISLHWVFRPLVVLPESCVLGVVAMHGLRIHDVIKGEGMTDREGLIERIKFIALSCVLLSTIGAVAFVGTLGVFWVHPVPFSHGIVICCAPIAGTFLFAYAWFRYPKKYRLPPGQYFRIFIGIVVLSSFYILIPASIAPYLWLTGFEQFSLALLIGTMRCVYGFIFEFVASELDVRFQLIGLLTINVLYETYSNILFTGATSTATLVLPPIMDFLGNLVSMIYIYYAVLSPQKQLMYLIELSFREVVELVSSVGSMVNIVIVWWLRREDYYMLDSLSKEKLWGAVYASFTDFVAELVVLVIFYRVVQKIFKFRVLDLTQSVASFIGYVEFFALLMSINSIIFSFFMYQAGNDWYLNFDWLKEENIDNGKWCQTLRELELSCYNPESAAEIFARLNITIDVII